MRYVPYGELGDEPNVVVDGAPNDHTVLTLSHWPHSGTPAALKDDLSAQIAFRYLDGPDLHVTAEAVSNNHFDQDGLVSVFALVEPEAAQARRDLLVDLAAAGDFGTYRSRGAARAAMAVAADAQGGYEGWLPRLVELVDHPERYRDLWEDEDRLLTDSEAAIASGAVTIEEVPALDLAIVMLPDAAPQATAHRFTIALSAACHPMAVNNATARNRILRVAGRRYEVELRYESWVQHVTAPPLPRPDLTPLAEELSVDEPGGASWVFDGVADIVPRLWLRGADESAIPPDVFRHRVEAFLAHAPPAWNPYDEPAATRS